MLPFTALDEPPERAWRSWATRPARPRAPTRSSSRTRAIDGVEIDGELSEIGRRYFDMNNPRPAPLPRGRAPVPAPDRRRLRRDLGRRLPPALHPVLPGDARSSSSSAATGCADGGVLIVNAGHPEGQDDLEKVLERDDGRGLPERPARPDRGHEHAARGERGAACRRSACAARRRAAARDPRARARPRRRGSAPRLEGGDVYTDDKAPVEWLIDKSIVEYAAGDDD